MIFYSKLIIKYNSNQYNIKNKLRLWYLNNVYDIEKNDYVL